MTYQYQKGVMILLPLWAALSLKQVHGNTENNDFVVTAMQWNLPEKRAQRVGPNGPGVMYGPVTKLTQVQSRDHLGDIETHQNNHKIGTDQNLTVMPTAAPITALHKGEKAALHRGEKAEVIIRRQQQLNNSGGTCKSFQRKFYDVLRIMTAAGKDNAEEKDNTERSLLVKTTMIAKSMSRNPEKFLLPFMKPIMTLLKTILKSFSKKERRACNKKATPKPSQSHISKAFGQNPTILKNRKESPPITENPSTFMQVEKTNSAQGPPKDTENPSTFMQMTTNSTHNRQLTEIMDLDKPWGVVVLDILCLATPLILFLAPVTVFGPVTRARCQHGKQSSRSHVVMPPLHFSAMYMQCYAFTIFGFGIQEPVLYLHTIPGTILGAIWLALYAKFYAEEESFDKIKQNSRSMQSIPLEELELQNQPSLRKPSLRRYTYLATVVISYLLMIFLSGFFE